MSKIRILDPLVAERIAAGEVIERPASVVKELVENSLDAGATEISVRLINGGKDLIEVIDNGYGMSAEDLEICKLRHATSKISDVSDLEKLTTLGFRGEALPSIAAVCELEIISRAKDDNNPQHGSFLGSPHGTRMRASGLFSQIPARLKFLKSENSEVSHVREWIERLAFTHPETGFTLESGDRTILNLRPESTELRVKRLLSGDTDVPLVSTEISHGSGMRLRAYWLQGMSSPQLKKLIQIVNGRAVRDRLLQQAILSPFKQALLPGQFPAVAVYLDLPPYLLDVNVHPTKTELRFLNSSQIFRFVESGIESLIQKHGVISFATGETSQLSPESFTATPTAWNFSAPRTSFSSAMTGGMSELPLQTHSQQTQDFTQNLIIQSHPFQPDRFVGSLFRTYLLYDLGEELALIDQHAADERIRYEKLKERALNKKQDSHSQQLLIPEVVHFNPENRRLIESGIPIIEQMGFDLELFGDNAIVFRAIPPEWLESELKTRLLALIERLLDYMSDDSAVQNKQLLLDDRLFEKLASEACHSAIRAGDRVQSHQAAALMQQLFDCEHPWNCPHGRPVITRIPRARFEEWFKRRV